jgi:hypothetical protein
MAQNCAEMFPENGDFEGKSYDFLPQKWSKNSDFGGHF